MLLRVKERLLLLNVLPQQGNAVTLRVMMKQQKALSFSEEELKELGFTYTGDKVEWKDEFDKPVDIPIGETATGLIVEALKNLDSMGQLKPEFLPIYDHFVEGKEWSPDTSS